MSFRSLTGIVVLAAAIVLGGCDGKGTSADTTDGGASPSAEVADPTMAKASTSTTTPVDFDAAVAALDDALDSAEGDLCALIAATNRPMSVVPETEEQARQVVDLIVRMVKSMGEVADPADEQLYEEAAERLEDEAEAKDFSPEWLTGADSFKALDDPEFFEASGRLHQRYQAQCAGSGTTAPG
jgi:hypothetical protein